MTEQTTEITENPPKKTIPGRFVKGQSGNPSGRPKAVFSVQALAREHTESAILTLVQIKDDPKAPHAARVAACNALLDRGYGKPTQAIELPPAPEMSREESIKDAVRRIAFMFAMSTDAQLNTVN